MSTRRLACPSCDAKLNVAATIPAGKRIKCPKCETAFVIPEAAELPRKKAVMAVQTRKAAPPPTDEDEDLDEEVEKRPARRKAAPPPTDEDEGLEEVEDRPRRKSRKKKRKQTSSNATLLLLIGGGVLLIGGGILAAVLLLNKDKTEEPSGSKGNASMASGQSGKNKMEELYGKSGGGQMPRPGMGGGPGMGGPGMGGPGKGGGPGKFGPGGGGLGPMNPGLGGGGGGMAAGGGGGNIDKSTGKTIFQTGCMKCHSINGLGKGHDLTNVTREHNDEWVANSIRNPKARRMPHFDEEKLNAEDMRKLLAYLKTPS
jgi:mono/diheme cytochrome c family protein